MAIWSRSSAALAGTAVLAVLAVTGASRAVTTGWVQRAGYLDVYNQTSPFKVPTS